MLLSDSYKPSSFSRKNGFNEARSLDFHSPYGCSKGAADQYVLDYARTFSLPAVVFRMSCIYGPHQFGNEHQGWVAHFLLRALEGCPITLYGDGKQVRDILFVEDLVEGLLLAQQQIGAITGEAFDIGGGPVNTTSLVELVDLISELEGKRPTVKFNAWRPADHQYYVSDHRKSTALTGWKPKIDVREGVRTLRDWLIESRNIPDSSLAGTREESLETVGQIDTRLILKPRSAPVLLNLKEPRSKRLWKSQANDEKVLERKIIKFS